MLGTTHFGLVVRDLERSVAFYQGILGMDLIGTMERSGEDISRIVALPDAVLKIAFLRLPRSDVKLELIQYVRPQGQPVDNLPCNSGIGHICFSVDDIQATHAAMQAKGVRFRSDPVEITTGMNRGAWAVYLEDPDGISLELLQAAPGRGN